MWACALSRPQRVGQIDDLSRVYPASHPVAAGIDSSPIHPRPWWGQVEENEWMDGWMDQSKWMEVSKFTTSQLTYQCGTKTVCNCFSERILKTPFSNVAIRLWLWISCFRLGIDCEVTPLVLQSFCVWEAQPPQARLPPLPLQCSPWLDLLPLSKEEHFIKHTHMGTHTCFLCYISINILYLDIWTVGIFSGLGRLMLQNKIMF